MGQLLFRQVLIKAWLGVGALSQAALVQLRVVSGLTGNSFADVLATNSPGAVPDPRCGCRQGNVALVASVLLQSGPGL